MQRYSSRSHDEIIARRKIETLFIDGLKFMLVGPQALSMSIKRLFNSIRYQ